MELLDYKKSSSRFFLRAGDTKAQIEAAFGTVEYKALPELSGEVGVLTGEMTEEEYRERAAKLEQIHGMIRMA